MIREFRLSPPGGGRGLSCDASGAFIGNVPLLKRSGNDQWEPRDCEQLSKLIGAEFGLPIDMSLKMGGLNAISRALNEGNIAKAQIATVLLAIPDQPPFGKSANALSDRIKFIRDLFLSNLIKADWDSDEHPRWPAGAPDSQGGQFAPKGEAETDGSRTSVPAAAHNEQSRYENASLVPVAANIRDDISRKPPRRKSDQECEAQLASDMYVCGSLRDKQERAICRSSAMQRYSACVTGKPLPH